MATSRPSRFPRVPYGSIRRYVAQLHVSHEPLDLLADIAKRARRAHATDSETREAIRYALACHEENRQLFRAVTSGRL